jgi:hypothetical protein
MDVIDDNLQENSCQWVRVTRDGNMEETNNLRAQKVGHLTSLEKDELQKNYR